jgi:acyl-CoA-binding protein
MVSMSYFDKTVEKSSTLKLKKSDTYYLNGLYNQVKIGNAPIDSSNITDINELCVWNEWNKNRNMNQEICMNKYCDYITMIIGLQEKNVYKYD